MVAVIGYERVSTREEGQVLDRQTDAFKVASCDRVFEDRASGARADRPGFAACLDHLRSGDVLVVLDLDRLGRRAGELIRLVDELESRGVGFRALNASFQHWVDHSDNDIAGYYPAATTMFFGITLGLLL